MSGGPAYHSMEPVFIDQLAVDLVVHEKRWGVKLTSAEKRHAAHGLRKMGASLDQACEIMSVTQRTMARLLVHPPPPVLDVNPDGMLVTEAGQVLREAPDVYCKLCPRLVYNRELNLCRLHYRRQMAGLEMDTPHRFFGDDDPALIPENQIRRGRSTKGGALSLTTR